MGKARARWPLSRTKERQGAFNADGSLMAKAREVEKDKGKQAGAGGRWVEARAQPGAQGKARLEQAAGGRTGHGQAGAGSRWVKTRAW